MCFAKSVLVASSLALCGLACSRPGGPGTSNEFGADPQIFTAGLTCAPVASSESLPPRTVVTDPGAGGGDDNVVFTSVLFDRFTGVCGACHVSSNQGNWSVSSKGLFAQLVTQDVIDRRIKTDAPGTGGFMPPANAGGKPYSQRGPDDPVVQLVGLLELWIRQGSPLNQFSLTAAADGGAPDGGAGPGQEGGTPPQANDGGARPTVGSSLVDYSLTPEQGANLTNLGTCVPSRYAVGVNSRTMDQLDAFFEAATELPETLAETDLISFDSDTLARNGVVSFVPAYPLWSDAAGKMRHVRTPRGQPIVFDKATQRFDIPPNTRFYKTFFKKTVQLDGTEAEKKIETRLIVSRPDRTLPDGTIEQTALFGTYLWDENETRAVLLTDPLHNGKPFADRVITYVVDQPRYEAIVASNPRNLEYELDTNNPGVVRHYAVPSSERCVQCHMGSASASFVLGFMPLQIATVPPGSSGVIEPASGDELTQLARLIAYGVISGMTSPADVVPLERSQLPRAPRNDQELRAQAYMAGNCAHCHNPRGFPSTKAPELKDVLNFLPGPDGGIFQFPLDRTSPVRERGNNHDIPVPYITPSLRDLPADAKVLACMDPTPELSLWCTTPTLASDGVEYQPYQVYVDAPWRSLVYRNVDTPFDYVDDSTIFPHMPMNTPGYDCRVPQIMGDWMVSIPAARINTGPENSDATPQPYVEVNPGDAAYAKALSDAKKRLDTYHAGHRYNFCADTTDIVDPSIGTGEPPIQTPSANPVYDNSTSPPELVMPGISVPNRPHWVVTDATDPPGDWLPRGDGWEEAIVKHMVAADSGLVGSALNALTSVIATLPDVTLTPEVRAAFLTESPFAMWQQKPGCDFSGVPKAADFQGTDRPFWFAKDVSALRDPGAPVYMLSPGAAVFTNICINCHGPQADAKGLLADEISIMTGGNARVANFRTGLFGPDTATSGAGRQRVFGPDAVAPLTADDLGARYLSWMALGGTKKQLPQALIDIVAHTPIAGKPRPLGSQTGSANMLQLARQLCSQVLLSDTNYGNAELTQTQQFLDWTGLSTALINANGDAELWLKVCGFGNRSVVRVADPDSNLSGLESKWTANVQVKDLQNGTARTDLYIGGKELYWGDAYPSDADVMDHRGQIRKGITADNLVPTCVREPKDATALQVAEASRHVGGDGGYVIPWCPPALFDLASDGTSKWHLAVTQQGVSGGFLYSDADQWATRGAVNAGFAVFLYVDQLSKGLIQAKPLYNQCELLNKAPVH